MLDGINYYPRKRKPILSRLIWLFLFFLIFGSIWYYFQDIDLGKSKSKSIIISKPSSLVETQDTMLLATLMNQFQYQTLRVKLKTLMKL